MDIQFITEKVNLLAHEWSEFKAKNNLEELNNKIMKYSNQASKIETILSRPSSEVKMLGNSSMQEFIRYGNTQSLETKSLNSTTNDAGGVLIEPYLLKRIVEAMYAESPMRQLASIETISSSALDIVIEDGKFACGWVNEVDTRKDDTTPAKLRKVRIQTHELFAQPKASMVLLEDSEINIEEWITQRLKDAFLAAENEAFINGNGKNKPKGILQYDPSVVSVTTIKDRAKFAPESLLELINALPEIYLGNATFLMNRTTLSEIQKFKDQLGRFIWQPSLVAKTPDTIFGIPVVLCSDMPKIGDGAPCIALADFSAAYKIVDRRDISIVRDPFTDKPFVKFYATKRVGGEVVSPNAIKLLQV